MQQDSKISFNVLLALVFLLPIFFLPTQVIPLGLAKISILVIASIVCFAVLAYKMFKERSVAVVDTKLILVVLALPLIYIVSSLTSASPMFSMFGYALESTTAGSILALSLLLLASAQIFRDRSSLIKVLTFFFVSLVILAIFTVIKIVTGDSFLTLNTFYGKMGTPIGAWTDLAVTMGLLSVMTIFVTEMLPLAKRIKFFTKILFLLSVVLLVIINFFTAWMLVLCSALVLMIYFGTVEKVEGIAYRKREGVRMAAILLVLSAVLILNPSVNGKDLTTKISEVTGVVNSDVRPNLKSTMIVAKTTLAKNPVLGSGPNTFDKEWLLSKPAETNATPFWNIAFPYGFGFIPTAVATTGILGTLAWAAFFVFYLMLGIKALSKSQENRSDKFIVISTFFVSLFLWVGAFSYAPSQTVIALAFIFTGLFIGALETTNVLNRKEYSFSQSRVKMFIALLLLIVAIAGVAVFGFLSGKKVLAATYFQKALVYSNEGKTMDQIESELGKAISISPADPYWSAVSQVELRRANEALTNTTATNEENQQTFQNALAASIAALQNAINLNPTYQNWVALGNIYSSLVPKAFGVEGAYESAKVAYQSALSKHPLSPEISLLMARLEVDNKNTKAAREFIAEAISKKSDYAEAYFFLAQLEIDQNNLDRAIESAETGTLLLPNNPGVLFQLGVMKYSNSDYKGAAEALVRALQLVPDYANAQYYLGLSLDKLGKKSEAVVQFENLAKTNPDNAQVTDVLRNLKAGRAALTPAAEKEEKESAPIKGQ